MTSCPWTCGHKQMVDAYRQERERQVSDAWERARGYSTEFEELRPGLVTFKKWLLGIAGRRSYTNQRS